MSALIIDYGMSNLGSMRRAVEECGADVFVSDNPKDIELANHLILPGVGAFPDGMRNLKTGGWDIAIKGAVSEGVPLLGICLGMQLLADKSNENGITEGLGLIKGEVLLLESKDPKEKIPHVGWNDISKRKPDSIILSGVPDRTDFYFVHSYHFAPKCADDILAVTDYCGGFASIVGRANVFGTQFHPEKSGKMGFRVLKNFLDFYTVD